MTNRLETLAERYRELAEIAKGIEGERDTYIALAGEYDVRTAQCESNNDALYTIAMEVIESYEKKGFFKILAQREPITGLKKVQIENLMDDYRQLADEMRLSYPDILGEEEEAAVDTGAGEATTAGQ